ncbi:MAG: tetratricopeptide repeat protein, partial [Microthrixaceae bacterium]|nr:tetratricopeptide repeat protein [Microthrixaceae bacterium]
MTAPPRWTPSAHDAVLGELVEWWEDVSDGSGACFLRLPTPPDWGTELVLESLVNHLVASQPNDEQFFSPLAPGESSLTVNDASAFPSFVAFGVSCAPGVDAAQPDLVEFQRQLSQWQQDLLAASETSKTSQTGAVGLGQLQSAAEILATAVGATVMGAGLTLASAVRGQYQSVSDFKTRFNIFSLDHRQSDRCADALAHLSRRIPVLVTVREAEHASSEFVRFLTELVDQPDARVLVLLSHTAGSEVSWVQPLRDRVSVYSVDVAEPTAPELRAEVQRWSGTAGGAEFVEAAVGRLTSLGALTRFVSTPAVEASRAAGKLSADTVDSWRDPLHDPTEMSADDGRVLAAAAVIGLLVPLVWLESFAPSAPSDGTLDRLVAARWLRPLTNDLFCFSSESARLAVARHSGQYLTPEEESSIRAGAGVALRAALEPERATSAAVVWLLAFRAAQLEDPPRDLIEQAAGSAAASGALGTSQCLFDALGTAVAVDPSGVAQRVSALTGGLSESDDPLTTVTTGLMRLSFASRGWQQVADETAAALSELSQGTSAEILAAWWFELGERLAEHGEADRAHDAVSRSAALSPHWTVRVGEFIEEMASGYVLKQRMLHRLESEYQTACEQRIPASALIDLHEDIGHLAYELGQWKQAAEHFAQLAAASTSILGPEHPDTILARANLAVSYSQDGRAKDAIGIYEQVV